MTSKESAKFKIAVVGIGGVGGFVGGKLAAGFEDSGRVEVVLLARGENERAIRAGGLRLITSEGEQLVRAKLAGSRDLEDADLIVLCTKEYDLEETLSSLKDNIGPRAAILPLLNGADITERIAAVLPDREVWQGCIYIVSRLAAPGVIRETGGVCTIYFGSESGTTDKMRYVDEIFREAGISARLSDDITARIWEKFVFISAFAAATSYLDATVGEILETPEHRHFMDELVSEVKHVARAKKINISEETIRQMFGKLDRLPFDATSSMHTDFSHGKNTELQSLVGFVVEQAGKFSVPVPLYEKVYRTLAERQKSTSGE